MPFSQYFATAVLNWFKDTAFPTDLATIFISIHSGDPGVAGTSNDITNSVRGTANRVSVAASALGTVGAAGGGGFQISNTGTVQITASASNGSPVTATHFGIWDAITGGNFLASGSLNTSVSIVSGDTVQFNAGAMAIKVV